MLDKREFRKGKVIVREGTHGTSAFLIESGRVEVSKKDKDGQKKVLTTLKEKDVFGEMGLIAGWARTATCTALNDCTISILTRESFQQLPENNPGVLHIKKVMAERIKQNKGPAWMRKK